MKANIHASCVAYKNQGILFFGQSGSGKSDVCLRLIMEHGAKLVADDRVNLSVSDGKIKAVAPTILKDKLEVRGLGIVKLPSTSAAVCLAVQLAEDASQMERMPEEKFFEFGGISIPQITLCVQEASTPAKVLAALTML